MACVINGVVQAQCLPPKEFVRCAPRGAYTTVLVKQGFQAVDWETHLERLVRSMQALDLALEGFYSRWTAWLEAGGLDPLRALQQLLLPSVLACLQAVGASLREGKLALYIVIPPALEDSPLEVHVVAAPAPPAATAPGEAVVLGPPREIPIGKDSAWVAQRRRLEEAKPEGAAEVLLSTRDGRLLEGLITNLFIVAEDGGGGLVVLTAGTGEGVVWGTVRHRVLEACAGLGLALLERAPAAADRSTWREAFLTNGLRIVQPLSRISCGPGNVWGHPEWTLELGAPGAVTTCILEYVSARLSSTDLRSIKCC